MNEKIPEDLRMYAGKIVRELEKIQKIPGKTGLNITNLKKKTELTNTSINNALSALSTAKIVYMEIVGTSKFYHLKELKR